MYVSSTMQFMSREPALLHLSLNRKVNIRDTFGTCIFGVGCIKYLPIDRNSPMRLFKLNITALLPVDTLQSQYCSGSNI